MLGLGGKSQTGRDEGMQGVPEEKERNTKQKEDRVTTDVDSADLFYECISDV